MPSPTTLRAALAALFALILPPRPTELSRTLVTRLSGCELWAVTYRHNGRVFTRTERVGTV